MHVPASDALLLGISILLIASPSAAQDDAREAMAVRGESLQSNIDVQECINALDDETREMLNEYRSTMTQVEDLAACNEQLGRRVATQRVELADLWLLAGISAYRAGLAGAARESLEEAGKSDRYRDQALSLLRRINEG